MQGETGMAWWVWGLVATGVLALVAVMAWRSRRGDAATTFAPKEPTGMPLARAYSPKNVGNDASARPWEQDQMPFGRDTAPEPGTGARDARSATRSTAVVPPGFDVDAFLQTSKDNFITLQAAWDRADVPVLRAMMTDDMIDQIQVQLAEREGHTGAVLNQTEVLMLDAKLLAMEELPAAHMASVEFSGMIREEPAAGPNPFREVWSITRPKTGQDGWLVAGVQALQ